MDAEAELTRLLARPSPLLLPWLARWVAADDLRAVASAAALHLELVPGSRWPVVADSTAAVIARRWDTGDSELLHRVLRVLPPVAGHLAPEVRRALSWDAVPTAAAGYAAVAGDGEAARWAGGADLPPGWAALLAGDPARDPLPPLSHLRSLTVLREARQGRPVAPSPAEAAYLLPHLDPAPPGWPELAVTAVIQVTDLPDAAPQPGWYARAVAARVLPLIDGAEVEAVASVLGVPEAARLRARDRAVAPEEELAVADGGIPRLTTLANAVDAALLAELCLAAALAVRDDMDVGDAYSAKGPVSYGYDLPPVPTPGTAPGGGRPVRHVNVLVAPVGGSADSHRPLPADTDLEVLCSVGRLDPRGLTTGATFPDEFLPDTALDLAAVLTVEGTVRIAELHVPARSDSATVRLPLAGRPRGTPAEAASSLRAGQAASQARTGRSDSLRTASRRGWPWRQPDGSPVFPLRRSAARGSPARRARRACRRSAQHKGAGQAGHPAAGTGAEPADGGHRRRGNRPFSAQWRLQATPRTIAAEPRRGGTC